MTNQGRTDCILTLKSVATFLENVESDFMHNQLRHPGQEPNMQNLFQNLLNSLEDIRDMDDMTDHRIQNLQSSLTGISSAVQKKVVKRILFSNRAVEESRYLFQQTKAFLKTAIDFLRTDSVILLRWLENTYEECKKTCDECATSHEERLIEGICVPAASLIYLDMLRGFAGVNWQVLNIMWLAAGFRRTYKVRQEVN